MSHECCVCRKPLVHKAKGEGDSTSRTSLHRNSQGGGVTYSEYSIRIGQTLSCDILLLNQNHWLVITIFLSIWLADFNEISGYHFCCIESGALWDVIVNRNPCVLTLKRPKCVEEYLPTLGKWGVDSYIKTKLKLQAETFYIDLQSSYHGNGFIHMARVLDFVFHIASIGIMSMYL